MSFEDMARDVRMYVCLRCVRAHECRHVLAVPLAVGEWWEGGSCRSISFHRLHRAAPSCGMAHQNRLTSVDSHSPRNWHALFGTAVSFEIIAPSLMSGIENAKHLPRCIIPQISAVCGGEAGCGGGSVCSDRRLRLQHLGYGGYACTLV